MDRLVGGNAKSTQLQYDHRQDQALFMDSDYGKLRSIQNAYIEI